MEHYININNYNDIAKHLYDLTILISLDVIKDFFIDDAKVNEMIKLQYIEESSRFGGINYEIKNFKLFNINMNIDELKASFDYIQNVYVFNKRDIIEYSAILETIEEMKQLFNIKK